MIYLGVFSLPCHYRYKDIKDIIKNRLDFKKMFLRQTGNETLAFLESKEFAWFDKDSFNTIEQKDVTFLLVNLHLFVQHALPSMVHFRTICSTLSSSTSTDYH